MLDTRPIDTDENAPRRSGSADDADDSSPAASADASRAPGSKGLRISVRTRIVAVMTVVAAGAMLAVGAAAYLVQRDLNLASVDQRLQANLESARYIVESGPDLYTDSADSSADQSDWTGADHALYAIVGRMSPDDNTGAIGLIGGTPSIVPAEGLLDLDLRDQPGFIAHVNEQVNPTSAIIGTYAENGVAWRYLAVPLAVEDNEEDVVFVLAYDIAAELAEINDVARTYVIGVAIATVVVAVVALLVSTRLLRPLRHMRETAERVSGQSLSERLPVNGRDDVSDLASTMNDMLDRLDDALDSQRQLLSDVGHELKTPITIVRGNLEVMDVANPADVRETVALATDELDRMDVLVEDLSHAASLHGPAPILVEPTDAGDLMRRVIRKASSITGAEVTAGGVAEVVAQLDAGRITQALLQLAQNGVTHGDGQLELGSATRGTDLELWVRDRGPGVPETERDDVFSRFHRGDQGGSGLGLNIVQLIARAHGGTVRVDDAPDGGALFTIHLPNAVSPVGSGTLDLIVPPRPPMPPAAQSSGA